MDKIIKGVCHFTQHVFPAKKQMFEKLVQAQRPEVLFITCADSRIQPSIITQTDPGDLFILRNAGNLVPPYGSVFGGEAATIEYAVCVLKVKHIIVCGHTHCGAMKALIHGEEKMRALPAVRTWCSHAESTRRILFENHAHLSPEEMEPVAIRQNVLTQIENLRTHPSVAAAIARGELKLHGWIYQIENGEVHRYNPLSKQWASLLEDLTAQSIPAADLPDAAFATGYAF